MSAVPRDRVEIEAPAKLNLGLEVIGRREDGYHDVATIFLAIDLFDHLALTRHEELVLRCDSPELERDTNLALRALGLLRDESGAGDGAHLDLTKRIPAAAGLGGASSDAAAALLAAHELWRLGISRDRLQSIASRLGSDVPFFLHGGCALGRGRGDRLTTLPVPEGCWFVVAVPDVIIPRKTAMLYAFLEPADFSDGSRILDQADRLESGLPFEEDSLGNAFARPLYTHYPELTDLPDVMRQAGARSVAITGAGPAHYAPAADPQDAGRIAERLRDRLRDRARVIVVRPAPPRTARWGPL